jgi:tetratricopeptide (TPR) repeat protein
MIFLAHKIVAMPLDYASRFAQLTSQLQQWDDLIHRGSHDPRVFIHRGMTRFKLAQIQASIDDFNQAEAIAPNLTPYLWQRGLSYYYAEEFEAGARQFEIDLTVNDQDVEETVWRYLCHAKSHDPDYALRSLLPVHHDSRRVMRQVYSLFAGQSLPDNVLEKGKLEGNRGLFYAHLYIGLFYEAQGDNERSRHHITTACNYPLDDYMWDVAIVHQTLRQWTASA